MNAIYCSNYRHVWYFKAIPVLLGPYTIIGFTVLIALWSYSTESHKSDEDHMAVESRKQTPNSSRVWWWA